MTNVMPTLKDVTAGLKHRRNGAGTPSKPKSPRNAEPGADLAMRMLRKSFPPAMRRDLKQQRSLVVIIVPPSTDWRDMIQDAARDLFRSAAFFVVEDNQKTRKLELQEVALRSAASVGQSLIVTTGSMSGLAPAILVAADYRLQIKHPDRTLLAATLRAVFGARSTKGIPPQVGRESAAAALLATMRRNEDAARAVARMQELHRRNRSNAHFLLPPGPTLSELSGYGEAKRWGSNVAADLQDYRKGKIAWSELHSAAILHGPPGCGKTFFAAALARSCGVPLINTSLGRIFAETPGYLDSVIKGLSAAFQEARSRAPSILFIDELDALPDRNTLEGRGRDWWTSIVTHFLKLLDDERHGVIVLAATNMLARVDPAVLRAGRLELHFEIGPPDRTELAGIFHHHLGSSLTAAELKDLARLAQGATGAQVALLVKTAKATARRESRELRAHDIVQQLTRDDPGEEELYRICVHEAGHTIAAIALGRKVELLSAIGNGEMGGMVLTDRIGRIPTRQRLENEAMICLAGRAAEIVALGQASSASHRDLQSATQCIAAVHGSLGLGASLVHRVQLSHATSLLVDPGFRELVEVELRNLDEHCMMLLQSRRRELLELSDLLRSKRVLSGEEIEHLIRP